MISLLFFSALLAVLVIGPLCKMASETEMPQHTTDFKDTDLMKDDAIYNKWENGVYKD